MIDNSIVRQVNIDLITGDHNPIIEWFNDLCTKLYIIEAEVYHNDGGELIYYMIDHGINKWIFFRDDKNDEFWCNYSNYWSILELKFDINNIEIQNISKVLVENALNNSVERSLNYTIADTKLVENALNNSVATPTTTNVYNPFKIDRKLNDIIQIESIQKHE